MFSRSKPEWEGLSGREKKTVKDKKNNFRHLLNMTKFLRKCHVIEYKTTKSEFNWIAKLLIRSWRVRAACNLYPCPRSFISPFFDHNFFVYQVRFRKEQGKPLEPGYMLQPQNSLNYGFTLLCNPQPSILDLKCSIVMQILKAWERLKW